MTDLKLQFKRFNMNFNNKTVIVTGASSGIGLAMAKVFAEYGANVVLAARSGDKLGEIANQIGDKALAVQCDVSDEKQCQNLVNETVRVFGGVDILINNAGLSMRALFDDVDLSVMHKLMDVNFWGCVNCTKYALPYIQKANGSIVGISSVAGFHGLPARAGYSASKYAMHGFLETIRVENLYKKVHVMLVAPGFTESNVRFSALTADGSAQGQSPRAEGKMMTANEVAIRVVKGVAKRKRMVVMDFEGKGTRFIKCLSPKLLDKIFFNFMAKEPDSPLKKR